MTFLEKMNSIQKKKNSQALLERLRSQLRDKQQVKLISRANYLQLLGYNTESDSFSKGVRGLLEHTSQEDKVLFLDNYLLQESKTALSNADLAFIDSQKNDKSDKSLELAENVRFGVRERLLS